MTSRVSTLEGAVTDDRGEPSSGAMIIALPEDKSSWKIGSSRLRMTGTANEGRFTIRNMLAGRYFVVAVPRGRVFHEPRHIAGNLRSAGQRGDDGGRRRGRQAHPESPRVAGTAGTVTMVVPLVVAAFALAAQTLPRTGAPPRDAAPARQGTAVIKGRVTAGDTGLPLHRAVVSLAGGPQLSSNSSPTPGTGNRARDAAQPRGEQRWHLRVQRFARGNIPPAHYTRSVQGALPAHGFRRAGTARRRQANRAGRWADREANLALPRGGAIVGRVVDDVGEPVSRAAVFTLRITAGGSFLGMGRNFNPTDDQGRFPPVGLEPAEYIVGAEARNQSEAADDQSPEGFAITYLLPHPRNVKPAAYTSPPVRIRPAWRSP